MGGKPDMTHRSATRRLFAHLLISLLGLCMLYPILWMLSSSFKPERLIFSDPGLWPREFTLENYRTGWFAVRNITFGLFFKNSFVISTLAVVANVVTCSMAAFAFARLKFPLKRIWFSCMLATIMLPGHVTLVPQYSIFHSLDWIKRSCR